MGQIGERGDSTPRRSTLVERFSAAASSVSLRPLLAGPEGGGQRGQRCKRPGDAGHAGLEVRHALSPPPLRRGGGGEPPVVTRSIGRTGNGAGHGGGG